MEGDAVEDAVEEETKTETQRTDHMDVDEETNDLMHLADGYEDTDTSDDDYQFLNKLKRATPKADQQQMETMETRAGTSGMVTPHTHDYHQFHKTPTPESLARAESYLKLRQSVIDDQAQKLVNPANSAGSDLPTNPQGEPDLSNNPLFHRNNGLALKGRNDTSDKPEDTDMLQPVEEPIVEEDNQENTNSETGEQE
jgi:hypothetical protein